MQFEFKMLLKERAGKCTYSLFLSLVSAAFYFQTSPTHPRERAKAEAPVPEREVA